MHSPYSKERQVGQQQYRYQQKQNSVAKKEKDVSRLNLAEYKLFSEATLGMLEKRCPISGIVLYTSLEAIH